MARDSLTSELEKELTETVARLGATRKLKERLQKDRLAIRLRGGDSTEIDHEINETKNILDELTEHRKMIASRLLLAYPATTS
jgi:hypothetical protein